MTQLLNAQQIHEWDAWTIAHEPVSSIDLMERAATACAHKIKSLCSKEQPIYFFCGKGNNGGDGLAIARILYKKGRKLDVFVLDAEKKGTEDFLTNKRRLERLGVKIHILDARKPLPTFANNAIIVDALFGSGINKPLSGYPAELIVALNKISCTKIAIDVPSGMFLDQSSKGNIVFQADHTLTFQRLKFCFCLPENAVNFGKISILDIGLSDQFEVKEPCPFHIIDKNFVKKIYQPRNAYGNKGTFGHALLIAGNKGKMGALILAARSCLRSGVGLLTCHIPSSESQLLPMSIPEAMSTFREEVIDFSKYKAIGIGPGLGTTETLLLKNVLDHSKIPLVVDADALNMIAQHPKWLSLISENSILSPHPKEFERLFGVQDNDALRIQKALEISLQYPLTIILKGHNTLVAHAGKGYFNTTGNAGMATGGSGDTLTGILTSLLAQGYSGKSAAILGVYLHGLAGDLALEKESEESLLPSDITQYLGLAYKTIQ